MKKKIIVVNFFLSFAVLLAMLFQTVHSYEHILRQASEKHCHHKYTAGQKEITHSHTVDANCHICHFAFSTYIPNSFQAFTFHKTITETSYKFFYFEGISIFFKGSLFALRAPPAIF
ncbi:hypothetical protein [Flavobacterium sp.]|uniref:hypothetical protein n=1 Tax=Flavobacterium sp. TaxID=239 RepID=UPI0031E1EDF7